LPKRIYLPSPNFLPAASPLTALTAENQPPMNASIYGIAAIPGRAEYRMVSIVTTCDLVVLSDKVNCPQRGPTLPALRSGSSEAQMPTVLIVDDCRAVRKTLRRLLEKQLPSVVCSEAISGLDALAKTEASSPDLIILDLGMQGMNGFEVATILHKTKPQVPLFMFTSHDIPAVESQAASVGIRAVFSKLDINALLSQARELLNPSHALTTQEA